MDAGYEGGVLDESLVALAGEEGVGYCGVVAEDFLGGLGVDLACYSLVAEGARGGLFETWGLRSLECVSWLFLRVLGVRGCTMLGCGCGWGVGDGGFGYGIEGVGEDTGETFSVRVAHRGGGAHRDKAWRGSQWLRLRPARYNDL